jgi:GntR family transcriptional regulator
MEQIVHRIATGELGPGDQLPPVRRLARELKVNFNTVARAYRMLDEAGIISTQHGRGTYLLTPRSEETLGEVRREDLVRMTREFVSETDRLGIDLVTVREIIEQVLREYELR